MSNIPMKFLWVAFVKKSFLFCFAFISFNIVL